MAWRWRTCDLGVFTLRVPADWTSDEQYPATLILHDDPDELTITLVACGPPELAASGSAAQRELTRWLRTQHNIHLADAPHISASAGNFLAAAEAVTRHGPVFLWLSRLFGRRGPAHWRFWVALNPHMTIRVSCVGPAAALHEQHEILEQIIHSIRLPERDLLVGRSFAQAVVALARVCFPHTPVALLDEAHVRFGSGSGLLDLTSLYRRYLEAPEDLSGHVRESCGELQRARAGEPTRPWPQVRSQVLPCLVPAESLSAFGPHCVRQEWVNNLFIVYLPEGDARALAQDELDAWGLDGDDLHRQALANLAARSSELVMEGSRVGGCTMLALSGNDACNAARILLPDLHAKLRRYLGVTFYAAIPGRELLLVFSAERPEILARMRKQIDADYQRTTHPVSNRLFLATADGIAGDPDYADSFTL